MSQGFIPRSAMLRRQPLGADGGRPVSGEGLVDSVALQDALELDPRSEFTVGRTENNDLVLDHEELPLLISRRHAKFSLRGAGHIVVFDLGATNGTWVNEGKLPSGSSRRLEVGDTVSFGGPSCIMRNGFPVQNPFMFVLDPLPRTEHESDEDVVRLEPSPEQTYPQSDQTIVPNAASPGCELGSPMQMELPRIATPQNRLSRTLFHNVDRIASEQVGSPRGRDRDLNVDSNPSPTKKSKLLSWFARKPSPLAPQDEAAGSKGPDMLAVLQEHLECAICQDWIVGGHSIVPCGHMYCGGCLYTLLRSSQSTPTCPSCRAEMNAPPVRCLPVENIVHEAVQELLDSKSADELVKRHNKWVRVQPRAATAWTEYFDRRTGGSRRRMQRVGSGPTPEPFQQTNLNLVSMLNNLRQVRETLRSVTNAEDPQDDGQEAAEYEVNESATTYQADYARSSRSRCAACRTFISAGSLRVGVTTAELQGPVLNQHRYISTAWHHLDCVPDALWVSMSDVRVHGVAQLAILDQVELGTRVSRATVSSRHR